MVEDISLLMSFIYNKNINGPNTLPWGTPDFTGSVLDAWLSEITF